MQRNILLKACLLSCISLTTNPSTAHAEQADWENHDVLQRNRLPARASFVPYATAQQALADKREDSPWFHSLNGDWQFHWVPRPEERPTEFYRSGFDAGSWSTIPVPSSWEIHGYGTPIYVSAGYPFRIDPPRVTSEPPASYTAHQERNPVGSYLREFTVPPTWKDRRVVLHFAGVESAFYVWVNGKQAGL